MKMFDIVYTIGVLATLIIGVLISTVYFFIAVAVSNFFGLSAGETLFGTIMVFQCFRLSIKVLDRPGKGLYAKLLQRS